jgi:diguanylate cyclase (GGDEF)-like protein
LLVQEDCIAVIVLYSTEAGIFDQDELTLLAELSEDISFALSYIDQEEKAHHAAYHDPVTGLGNRAFLYERLGVAVRKATAKGHACALMLLDIINFNEINSALGHANGDLLLKQFAERLRTKLWESDAVACLGGDEFAVLLPRLADSEDIRLVTGKVASALRSDFVVASVAVSVDVRMGYAVYPAQADSPELLWQRAAIALREARRRNQDRVHYDPAMDRYDPRQLALLGELRQAIDSNELVLHYQPKIDLRKGTVMGAEALVRWQHPARGMIYPDAFIPLAERTSSLIVLLTTWVAANAMRQGRVWQRAGLELDIAVNLSVRNLHHPDLVSEFLDIARSAKFPLDRVTLEITENAIMADPARGKAVLSELHGAGIRFSMDDFGIGQSSLTYLKDLPIAQLKIDKSFVIGFREPRNRAIVQAALELGHSLGMEVTAEGIEDVATCDSLREMGCDIGQGYYISKPLPPDQFLEWCRTSAWGVHRKKPVRRTRSGGKSGTKGKSKRVGKRSGRRR